jgi:zinc protease
VLSWRREIAPENAELNALTAIARAATFLVLVVVLLHAAPSRAALELKDAERIELDSGLTVLLLEDRNFPVVSVQTLYKVGARNEVTGKTGLAHFLEHMAFRATQKYPDTEVVSRIYGQGGEWHGYTWIDQTTYFATAPKDDLDLLLDIEAERMARLVIDPAFIEAERGAVLAEMHMYENDPGTMLIDALLFTSFLAHPYRNNTIGWESDIENVTHADAVDFYRAHYHPANAVLAVVGDFDRQQVLERIEALFGDMERRPATPLPHTVEPLQRGVRRINLSGAAPGRRFVIGYRAPAAAHPDFAAFLVLQEILAGGSGVSFLQNDWGTDAKAGSILHGAADGLTTWFPPSAQNYLFVIGGDVDDERSDQAVEQEIETRVATVRDRAPETKRLDAAIDAILDELAFDVQTTEDAAHQLAYFQGLGALDLLLTLPERVRLVTAKDVTRVAREWLQPERRTIGWYRLGAPPAAPAAGDATIFEKRERDAIDEAAVPAATRRVLSGGVPAIVRSSDLSSSVSLRVIVLGTALTGDSFRANSPEAGTLSWLGEGRPDALETLAANASKALAAARHAEPSAPPQSIDPETRLREEFLALMAPAGAEPGSPALPAAVVVSGDVDSDAAFDILEAQFGRFARGTMPASARSMTPTSRKAVELGLPIAQSQLGYIVAAPGPDEPGYFAWRLLQYIVAHGYEGRLGKEAISRRGLAYYIDARYSSAGGPGWTTLSVGVDTHKLDKLESLMAVEFERLASSPPTQEEVDEAKRHLVGRAISAAQSNDEIVSSLGRHWLRHDTLPSVDQLREQLEAVTLEHVRAMVPAFTCGVTIAVMP